MALRVIEGLVAEFAATEQALLLDEPIIGALLSLDRSLVQILRLIATLISFRGVSTVTMLFQPVTAWQRTTLSQEILLSGDFRMHHLNPSLYLTSIFCCALSLLRHL